MEPALTDADPVIAVASVRGATSVLPIVVLARDGRDSVALRLLQAGAQECLAKSQLTAESLGRALAFAIERQRRFVSLDAERLEATHRASHDPLTGLANRDLFLEQLHQALALDSRYGRKTGLLFVDLDDFKEINDIHGHARGDALLRLVSTRLLGCVRRSDAVARLGGDEFVVLLPDVTSRLDVALVRDSICSSLHEPLTIGDHELSINASVGAAMSPLDGITAQELLEAADADMYQRKTASRLARSPDLATHAAGTTRSGTRSADAPHGRESRLRDAIRDGEFEVFAQPIVDVAAGRVLAAETLLRWRDPERGLLLPSSFLSLAEDTGLVVPLGEFVLREACTAVVRWRSHAVTAGMCVSANISAVQLRERGFAERVACILRDTSCPGDALVLELTERSLLVDADLATSSLRALHALGVRLVVDDFGVGHASMTFVRDMPVDGIKIDRRFVTNMLADSRDFAIVASMSRLAHGLNLEVTAEGVESLEHSRQLLRLECTAQQGRFLGRELPMVEFEALLPSYAAATRRAIESPKRRNDERSTRVRSDEASVVVHGG